LPEHQPHRAVRDFFFKPDDVEPVEVLVQNGMDDYDAGDYKAALENFQKLKDWYPFSKYVTLAELKIADSHYHREEYAEAVLAYQEFADLHPNNEAVPYVIYQIGRCYFDQIDAIDRDQSTTRKAVDTFLHYCVTECLRMYGIVTTMLRTCNEKTTLNGYKFKSGDQLLIANSMLTRSP